ncbi:MAG: hypothetical protein IPN63_07800 [Gammaproteobacteria bacterium]|nr:hypothetical protein [Gammaproteobacteria bacterium]
MRQTLKAHAAKLDLEASRFAACWMMKGQGPVGGRHGAEQQTQGRRHAWGYGPSSPGKVRLTARIPGRRRLSVFSGAIDAMLAPADAKP